jgi:GNAT superfamily N-acetyltransferase
MRKIGDGQCELKRMYVRPDFRRLGIGRKVVEMLIDDARQIGYKRIYLDTAVVQNAAQGLYLTCGFQPTEAYYPASDEYMADSVFMKLGL